ncbi:hypothetical protein [Corynebacterium deserti]|uniref:hypothetical protein n=1 Tax=Corynebacterium deserti TaxID=1408191 RepID=UPI0012E1EEBD|nr:hypothetical protein [Corynebacterium deserti]
MQRYTADHLPDCPPIPQQCIDDDANQLHLTEMQLGPGYFATVFPHQQHLL